MDFPYSFSRITGKKLNKAFQTTFFSFLESGYLLKEQNRTCITLIPKIDRPKTVDHFKPINLYNTSYKIIYKSLVGRLKLILGDLIREFQSAFVPSRQMINNCLIAHEVIDWVKRRKKGTL